MLSPTLGVIVDGINTALKENYYDTFKTDINQYLFIGFLFAYLYILLNPKTSLKRYKKESNIFDIFPFNKFIHIWRALYHFGRLDDIEKINNEKMKIFIVPNGNFNFN